MNLKLFLSILTLIFLISLISASANYGEGTYGAGVYGLASCGDNVCDTSESCSICSADCGACTTGGDTGGSGGGGGGSTVTADGDYIEKISVLGELSEGEKGAVTNFDEDFGINKISVEVSKLTSNPKVTVRKYHSKPLNVTEAPGVIYKYLQIEVQNLDNLKEAIINLQVDKSWISENNVNNETISLYKFYEDSREWKKLNTNLTNETELDYFYDTLLNSFSYFAISGESLKIPVPGEGLIFKSPETGEGYELNRGGILWLLLVVLIISAIISTFMILERFRGNKELRAIGRQLQLESLANHIGLHHKIKIHHKRKIRNVIIPSILTLILIFSLFGISVLLLTQNPLNYQITGFITDNLPDVGDSSWGTILNNFLLQEHTTNGTHGNVTTNKINSSDWSNVTITESQIGDLQNYRTEDNLTFNGDVNVTGNLSVGEMEFSSWPSFSSNMSADQTTDTNPTKVQFDTEVFDTNGNFNISSYRFTPTVAGKYLIITSMKFIGSGGTVSLSIYKNGIAYRTTTHSTSDTNGPLSLFEIIDLNGVTDYIEIYIEGGDASYSVDSSDTTTSVSGAYFSGSRIA